MVGITGALPTKQDTPAVPIMPSDQIESTHEAYEAGASLVHIHVRNEDQTPMALNLSQNTDASRVRLRSDDWGTIRECLGGFAACGLLRK